MDIYDELNASPHDIIYYDGGIYLLGDDGSKLPPLILICGVGRNKVYYYGKRFHENKGGSERYHYFDVSSLRELIENGINLGNAKEIFTDVVQTLNI